MIDWIFRWKYADAYGRLGMRWGMKREKKKNVEETRKCIERETKRNKKP